MDHNQAVEKVIREFDTSQDSQVDFDEFIVGVEKWLAEAKEANEPNHAADSMKYIDAFHSVCCFKRTYVPCITTNSKCLMLVFVFHFPGNKETAFSFGSSE